MSNNDQLCQGSSSKHSVYAPTSPGGGCPCIDALTSFGLYAWTQEKEINPILVAAAEKDSNSPAPVPETENYLFLPATLVEDTPPNEYCDFVFPVLMGYPHNTPLDKKWIDKIPEQFKPGCYLVAQVTHSSPNLQHVPVSVFRVPSFKTFLERINANLYFVAFSANPADKNFNRQAVIDRLDDVDKIKGYYYPCNLKDSVMETIVVQKSLPRMTPPKSPQPQRVKSPSPCGLKMEAWMTFDQQPQSGTFKSQTGKQDQGVIERQKSCCSLERISEADYKKRTGVARVMKRYCDQVAMHAMHKPGLEHLKHSLVSAKPYTEEEYISERFNFLLAQDSYAVIIDHNSQSTPQQNTASGHAVPYLRLVRAGAYLCFEGNVRYANLSQHTLTYLNRYNFLSRFTTFPLVIVQEGIKAFDVYYANDGLDATYIDIVQPSDLIQLNWHQLQMDFKLDQAPRHFKGHIVYAEELTDLLTTFRPEMLQYEMDLAARLAFLELPSKIPDPTIASRLVLTLQQVTYNYINAISGHMEIVWNVYIKLDSEHIEPPQPKTGDSSGNPPTLYLYLKSFICSYHWSRATTSAKVKEQTGFEVVWSDQSVTATDLYRAGWSLADFNQWLTVYLNRMYPYQNSIKKWLLIESRKLTAHEHRHKFFTRPTTLADKLAYRNAYYNARIKPSGSEKAAQGLKEPKATQEGRGQSSKPVPAQ